jgi:hypothetical protein
VDETFNSLHVVGQQAAQQMFLRLVTLGEGAEDTRRRVLHSDILALSPDQDLIEDVIDTFAELTAIPGQDDL